MLLIRPIVASDFNALKQIAVESGHGFTSLPNNDELLLGKIQKAEDSFSAYVNAPGNQSYLFVLEDTEIQEVVGIAGIKAAAGLSAPLYHYRLSTIKNHSPSLEVNKSINMLTSCNDYKGATEVCTLFVREQYRKGNAGKLMSRVRFMFMATHPERFSNTIIAEMRGVSDSKGRSPFWAWLEEHFFGIDFPTADYLVGIGDKGFISELMPKHPIYTSLLSKEAQEVIGQVHKKTAPALKLLEKEGFKFNGYVDLFDAGPTVEAPLQSISTVSQSKSCKVNIAQTSGDQSFFICNELIKDFRATATNQASYDIDKNILTISPNIASTLLLKTDDHIRFLCI